MKNRRKFLMFLTTGFVAMAVIVGSAIADELIGYISKVDVDGKKATVVDKDDKETEITITADTEYVYTKKGEKQSGKIELEKFAKQVEQAKEKNKKGLNVTVTHEKGTASKIEQKQFKKKAAASSNN
jgi:Golgi nucleoside diphosphatase